jgi:trans-aconitate 2-methyltransferase
MIINQDGIAHYYDEFFKDPVYVRVNERIIFCYKMLVKQGLRSSSTILELGCGGGGLTFLLSRKIRRGTIEAIDLSPYAIDFAKTQIKSKNVRFAVQDIVHYRSGLFDFITLFDVLEHVPIPAQPSLFRNIETMMTEHSLLLVNIPNPRYLEFDQVYHPETLQIIDQPLHTDYLTKLISDHGLYLHSLETNSIWVEDDYQFLVIKKKGPFVERKLSEMRSFRGKAAAWLKRKRNSLHYKYPN